MRTEDLKRVMKYYLKSFNNGKPVGDTTKHRSILSATDGKGTANSKQLYKSFVRWSLAQDKKPSDPRWPADWMETTVQELADILISRSTK